MFELLRYLRKPVFYHRSIRRLTFNGFLVLFLLTSFFSYLFGEIDHSNLLKNFLGFSANKTEEDLNGHSILYAIFTVSVFPSILEEFIFRYYLRYVWASYIYLLINIFLIISSLLLLKLDNKINIILLIVSLLIFVIYSISGNIKYKHEKLKKFLSRNFGWFFYISAIAFGLLHLINYNFKNHVIIVPAILIIPQIIGGVLLNYSRIKYGIFSSILLHFANNFLFVCFYFLNKS